MEAPRIRLSRLANPSSCGKVRPNPPSGIEVIVAYEAHQVKTCQWHGSSPDRRQVGEHTVVVSLLGAMPTSGGHTLAHLNGYQEGRVRLSACVHHADSEGDPEPARSGLPSSTQRLRPGDRGGASTAVVAGVGSFLPLMCGPESRAAPAVPLSGRPGTESPAYRSSPASRPVPGTSPSGQTVNSRITTFRNTACPSIVNSASAVSDGSGKASVECTYRPSPTNISTDVRSTRIRRRTVPADRSTGVRLSCQRPEVSGLTV